MEPNRPMQQNTQNIITYLRSTKAIRDRCQYLFDLACQDRLQHFRCCLERLDEVADYVTKVMQSSYPDLQIPFHSRWRHFEIGGIPRIAQLDRQLLQLSTLEKVRTKFDLVITSVLLDAGAGKAWQYVEPQTGAVFQRSEGLAVASFHLFTQGRFSSDLEFPFQADADGLSSLSKMQLCQGFQVDEKNLLIGVEGRLDLMQRLGSVLWRSPQMFGVRQPRPGYLVDYLIQQSDGHSICAHRIFEAVLEGFSEIWSGRTSIDEVNLGDTWTHSGLPKNELGSQLVPFHKLSQWLTYSLLEPLQELGMVISNLDRLTGLAEYRNGGLCIDSGLLQPKHEAVMGDRHLPSSEVVVEWRALTVILLDRIAETIRRQLNLNESEFPLTKILQGGTWAAGRQIASEQRLEGTSPIKIVSDGTVF